MLDKHCLVVILLVLGKISYSNCSRKVWLPDTNINNPRNWYSGPKSGDCHGLIFSESNEVTVDIGDLRTEQLVLPRDGDITFNSIDFLPKSKCVRLKPFKEHFYYDWTNWATKYETSNVAIPHAERVPCRYDIIEFPENSEDFMEAKGTLDRFHTFEYNNGVAYPEMYCADPSGCICGVDEEDVCLYAEEDTILNCLDPIIPIGFCNHMCGVQILLIPKTSFVMKKIEDAISKYNDIDTHVSKVLNKTGMFIQVIFAEKKFTGNCLDYARDFYSKLEDEEYAVKRLELRLSGPYYVEGQSGNTISLVFGSLAGVLSVFALIFIYYNTKLAETDFVKRINFRNRPISRINDFFGTARYNRQGSNLSFETQSLASSAISLEKSFDNPMFGSGPTNTGYGSINPEAGTSKAEIAHENPLYDLGKSEKMESKELVGILEEESEE